MTYSPEDEKNLDFIKDKIFNFVKSTAGGNLELSLLRIKLLSDPEINNGRLEIPALNELVNIANYRLVNADHKNPKRLVFHHDISLGEFSRQIYLCLPGHEPKKYRDEAPSNEPAGQYI